MDQLERLRAYFPAEVTGAYLGLVGVLKANDLGPSAYDDYMVYLVVPIFALVNVWIYWKFRNVRSIWTHLILALGFLLWVANIDTPRFRDVLWGFGANIELAAPVGLVLYVLITSFISLPSQTPVPDAGATPADTNKDVPE